jgi:hypothetical protein
MTKPTGKPVGRPPVGPRVTVRFYPAELDALRAEADRSGATASEIVRAAVVEKLERLAVMAEAHA